MKALIRTKAGKEFSSMKVQEISSASPTEGELKIKMSASRINPVDMDLMKGFPSLKYKKTQIGGIDGSGEILEIGSGVNHLKIGDKVFFYRAFTDIGTWAEEIIIPASNVANIPNNISIQEAGGIALPLITAYEAIDSLQPKSGESILIHGAGGGVGFQAVLLAKSLGLKVIANASSRDGEKLKSAGVDTIIDYKTTQFEEVLQNDVPDYVFDVIGKDTLMKSIMLQPKKIVSTSFPDPSKMYKTGVKLPGILVLLMKLMNKKFENAARKKGVKLIGQVTGPNGESLNKAARLIEKVNELSIQQREISFTEIEDRGLSAKSLGQVIVFN